MPIKAPQVPVRWPQRQRSVFLYICVAWLSHSHLRHIHMKLWLQRVMKVGQLSNIVPCAYSVGILEVSKSQNEYWKMMYSQNSPFFVILGNQGGSSPATQVPILRCWKGFLLFNNQALPHRLTKTIQAWLLKVSSNDDNGTKMSQQCPS